MKVKLLNEDFIMKQYEIAVKSARKCYNSSMDGGERDFKLLQNLMRAGHHTIFEQVDVVFEIDDVSRALIQQTSRHRMQSLNIKSTRFTIDKMLVEFKEQYEKLGYIEQELINKYFVYFPYSQKIIEIIMENIVTDDWEFNKKTNDILKYCFPEALKTSLVSKMNLRSFCNFYKLRNDSHAMEEIRELAKLQYSILPEKIKTLIDIYIEEVRF